jgi:predicted kinase
MVKSYFVIIRGPLGCGKSTIAKRLSALLDAKYISIDKILDENDLIKDREEGYISQKSFKKANDIVLPEVREVLDSGKSVIFDGNFYWKSQIEDLIEKVGCESYVFTLKASLEVCIDRDKKREKPLGEEATRVVYKKSTEFEYGIPIDITQPIEKVIEDILEKLSKNGS